MGKDPAVLFYTSDFLGGVTLMSMKERGQYITLLCLQRERGHMTEADMRKAIGGKLSTELRGKFTSDAEGKLYNVRMDVEIGKRAAHCEQQREKIQKRWQKIREENDENDSSTSRARVLYGGDTAAHTAEYTAEYTAVVPLGNGNGNGNGNTRKDSRTLSGVDEAKRGGRGSGGQGESGRGRIRTPPDAAGGAQNAAKGGAADAAAGPERAAARAGRCAVGPESASAAAGTGSSAAPPRGRPRWEDVRDYAAGRGWSERQARHFFDVYDSADWTDANGKAVRSWKQKMLWWEKDAEKKPQNSGCGDMSSEAEHKKLDHMKRMFATVCGGSGTGQGGSDNA